MIALHTSAIMYINDSFYKYLQHQNSMLPSAVVTARMCIKVGWFIILNKLKINRSEREGKYIPGLNKYTLFLWLLFNLGIIPKVWYFFYYSESLVFFHFILDIKKRKYETSAMIYLCYLYLRYQTQVQSSWVYSIKC